MLKRLNLMETVDFYNNYCSFSCLNKCCIRYNKMLVDKKQWLVKYTCTFTFAHRETE